MNKFLGILIGLVLLLVPIYTWIIDYAAFGSSALMVLKGGLMWAILLAGAVFLISSLSSLKD